jgi:exopolysaccharide biosynthesis polyprenyl glycosylphosphotransferase
MSDDTLKVLAIPVREPSALQLPRVSAPRPDTFPSQSHAVPALVRRLTAPLVRVSDQVAMTAALFLTLFSFSLAQGTSLESFLQVRVSVRNLAVEVGLLLAWRFIFWMAGLYQPRLNRSFVTFLWKVPMTAAFCTVLVLPLLHLSHLHPDLVTGGLLFWFFGATLMLLTRVAVYTYEERIRPAFRRRRTVLICGTGIRARLLALQLHAHPDFRYQLAGFIDTKPQPDCSMIAPVLGGVLELESILMRLPVDEVMVALPIKSHFAEIEEIVGVCGRAGIQTQYSLELFTSDVAKHHSVDSAEGTRVVVEMVHSDHRLVLKSTLDRIAATLGLIILSPLFLLIGLAVKLTSNGPVFFVQQRFGLGKRKFGMIKFRTMVVDAEARQASLEHLNEHNGPTFKMKSDPRITRLGAFLRRSSLDELPQLINVLKGEMSLVGPRPLPSRDVERFSAAWLMRRFSVKPGITGLWQVSGRSNTDFDNAIKLDLRYIDKWSLLLDVKILFRTLSAVAKGRGAY